MSSIADKILATVQRHGRGTRVYRANDFVRLGSASGVWQALARLVKTGKLRRVDRGLYDYPRHNKTLDTDVPPDVDAVATAVGAVAPDGLGAANAFGLTTAVAVRPVYITDGPTRTRKVGNVVIELQHRPKWLVALKDSLAMPIVQALYWLGPAGAADAVAKLRDKITPAVARALDIAVASVVGWLKGPISKLAAVA